MTSSADLLPQRGSRGTPRRTCARRGTPRTTRIMRRAGAPVAALLMVALALIAFGAAAGRYHVVPVDERAPGVGVSHDSLALIVPVPTLDLREGDLVAAQTGSGTQNVFYRVTAVDSWTHDVYTRDLRNRVIKLKLGSTTARVSRTVPYLGVPLREMRGTLQGIALLMAAMALFAYAITQRRQRRVARRSLRRRVGMWIAGMSGADAVFAARRREELVVALRAEVRNASRPRSRRPARRNPWWWTRLAAVAMTMLGVLSLSASASFTATASSSQTAITAGHMGFTLPAAGSTYRLQTGATSLAPGDVIERAVDLQIDSTTTAGLISGVSLSISASSTAGDGGGSYKLDDSTANSIRLWIEKCGVAWTTTDTAPYTYTACSSGQGDVLGTQSTSLATPGTCPPASGSVSSIYAAESGVTLNNLTLTASSHNYLVIFMCLPTSMDNNYQNASSTFTWNFTGSQRSATYK